MSTDGLGTNGMVLMCTVMEEKKENELYQMARSMQACLLRSKDVQGVDPRTTHLVVGGLEKTERFLCGLAAGIPMVDTSYVTDSHKAGYWIQDIERYDIGSPSHPLRKSHQGKMLVGDLRTRMARKQEGGVFKDWRAVVLLQDTRQQELYRRLLQLGGAKVERWTLQALVDLRECELSSVTHILSQPDMLANPSFRAFMERNDLGRRVPVVAYIYIGDFLTQSNLRPIQHFDIRQPSIIDLLAPTSDLRRLKLKVPDYLLEAPSTRHTSIYSPSTLGHQEEPPDTALPEEWSEEYDEGNYSASPSASATVNAGYGSKRIRDSSVSKEYNKKRKEDVNISAQSKGNSGRSDSADLDDLSISPGLRKLKATAQKLLRKPRDDNVTVPAQDEVITLEEPPRGADSSKESFLGVRRFGSTRQSSAKPPTLFRNDSHLSTASQDSFSSEADLPRSQLPSPSSLLEGEAGKLQYCHNLMVQRRTKVNRLDVGNGWVGLNADAIDKEAAYLQCPLSSSLCANIWTCLETAGEQQDLNRNVDEGWLKALQMISKLVTERRYLPSAALHKVLSEALLTHADPLVRAEALTILKQCVHFRLTRSKDPEMSLYFLHIFSKTRPNVAHWKFDSSEPWNFIEHMVEISLSKLEASGEVSSDDGAILVLQLIVYIVEKDLNFHFDSMIEEDSLSGDVKPILSQILFTDDSPKLNYRLEFLSKTLVKLFTEKNSEPLRVPLRKLVGFSAQLVQFQERISKTSVTNSLKLELSSFLATQIGYIFENSKATPEVVWSQLYLLQPTWLSTLVSGFCMSKVTTKAFLEEAPSLRSVIQGFINTNVDQNLSNGDSVEISLTPSKTSTPLSLKFGSQTLLDSNNSTPPKVISPNRKVVRNVNTKNKFGETRLHTAAKKGQTELLKNCLFTPGADINCKDNNGFTPLHEAVGANQLKSVELLLDHKPPGRTIDKFFTPTKSFKASKPSIGYVDLLAVEQEDGMNPLQEAVNNELLDVTRLILNKVAQEESKGDSPFPSVLDLFNAKSKNGRTIRELAKSDEMKQLINSFSKENQENLPLVSSKLQIHRQDLFGVLLELFLSKYISSFCLAPTYGMFKTVKVQQIYEAAQDHPDTPIKPNPAQQRWGPLHLEDGLVMGQFGKRPRFDVFRSEESKGRDLKDFEKLLFFKTSLNKLDKDHPLWPMLTLLKVRTC